MEEIQQKSWFKRNWKWFVPTVGCGTLIILFIIGIGTLVYGVTEFISGSTPATYAIEKATQNEKIITILGTPIEQKGMTMGEITFNNGNGSANLRIPIEGPDGKAIIHVVGEKYGDDWTYSELFVLIKESQEKINLLEKELDDF